MKPVGCIGKVRYNSWDEAHAHMTSIGKRAGTNRHPIRVYHCETCGGYHTTSMNYEQPLRPAKLKHAKDFKKFMQ